MTTINSGDSVEVQQVWAGGVHPRMSWLQGYVFVRFDGMDAIVQPTKGVFKGCNVRFRVSEIRPSRM